MFFAFCCVKAPVHLKSSEPAASREINHFVAELAEYIMNKDKDIPADIAKAQSEGMVTIVFTAGSHALDMNNQEREALKQRVILQLRMIAKGATLLLEHKSS